MSEHILAEARAAIERHAFAEAIALLRPLAEGGDREAQFRLGFLVLTECEDLSGREGFHWLTAAAEQGHAEAAYHVATFPVFTSEGFTSPLSPDESWQLLIRAAEAGCLGAQYDAGACLAAGEWREAIRPRDLRGALSWYQRAAHAGHSMAQFNFAWMLLEGEGCDADRKSGIYWLKRAAASGDSQAAQCLVDLGESEA